MSMYVNDSNDTHKGVDTTRDINSRVRVMMRSQLGLLANAAFEPFQTKMCAQRF